MTLLSKSPKSVGVRELHNRTSELMQQVITENLPLEITFRGKPVARITRIDEDSPIERLRREGLISGPERSSGRTPKPIKLPGGAIVSDLVSEQRR